MRRRNIHLLAILVSSGIVVTVAGPTALGWGGQPVRQVIAALSDPLAILEGRSPGARRGGVIQSKLAAAKADRPAPSERVLSGARERTSTPPAEPGPVTQAQELIDEVLPPEGPDLASLPVTPTAQLARGFSVPTVLVTSRNLGSVGGTGGDGDPIPLPTPTPPLPCPSPLPG